MAGTPDLHPVPEQPYDASDERQIKDKADKQAIRERQTRQVIADLLSTPAGRNWMWSVLSDCNVFSQTFVPQEADTTAFNEGIRSVGNKLIAQIMQTDPTLYVTMMTEQAKA